MGFIIGCVVVLGIIVAGCRSRKKRLGRYFSQCDY